MARMNIPSAECRVLPTLSKNVRQQISRHARCSNRGSSRCWVPWARSIETGALERSECRFDYHLGYVTDSGLCRREERFEKVFYAER